MISVKRLFFHALFLVVLSAQIVSAEVIFEDNFDDQSDWAPACQQCGHNANGYYGGGDKSGTPMNWNYWRNDEIWNPYAATGAITGTHPTMEITSQQHAGGAGKSLVIWNESTSGTSGDGWGSDGQLAKYLGESYNEIFVQLKLKLSPTFKFFFNTNNAAQIKMVRFYHTDNLNAPFADFAAGSNAPIALMKTHYKYYGGFGYDFQHRCDPQLSMYYCPINYDALAKDVGGNSPWYGAPSFDKWGITGPQGDGWHLLKFYGKLNSAPGAADGVIRFWQDGNLMYERTDIQWIASGGDINSGWNIISLGGNAYNRYDANLANHPEQWYVFDDLVVSSTDIPLGYVIRGKKAVPVPSGVMFAPKAPLVPP